MSVAPQTVYEAGCAIPCVKSISAKSCADSFLILRLFCLTPTTGEIPRRVVSYLGSEQEIVVAVNSGRLIPHFSLSSFAKEAVPDRSLPIGIHVDNPDN